MKPIWLLMMKCIRAADTVAAQAREAEALGNHALAGEGGVAVDQERQHAARWSSGTISPRLVGALVLLGARLAEHHRIDDLEVRRVGGQRQVDLVAVELAVRRGAEMVLDVARALDVVGRGRAALELVEDGADGLAITLASTLRRPRCAMPRTISFTPSWPPRLMICSSAGISDSPPSRPKRLVPVNFTSRNFSKPSASISLLRIAFLPSA